MSAKTLPVWAAAANLPANDLDPLRALVRNDPALRALGAHVGATRVFTAREFETIHAAFKAWQQARQSRRKVAAGAAV